MYTKSLRTTSTFSPFDARIHANVNFELTESFRREWNADIAAAGLPEALELAFGTFLLADDPDAGERIEVVAASAKEVGIDLTPPEPELPKGLELSQINDAIVYGVLPDEFLDRRLELGLSPFGAETRKGVWKPWPCSVRDFLNALSEHKIGQKDGNCFLQGPPLGGERTSNSIPHTDILVLDLDTGESIAAIRDKLFKLGLAAVIYTTFSHLKPVSDVSKDSVVRWLGSPDAVPDLEAVKGYLMEVKRYQPAVLEGAELLPQQHTKDGVKLFIRHQPMPKFRVVLFLKERFVIADRANTQAAGIAEWKERYAGASKLLGAFFDRSCTDPSRLFFTPRHPRSAKDFLIEVIAGNLLDIDTLERVTAEEVRRAGMTEWEREAEDTRAGAYKTPNMKRFFAKHGDRFDIETFLRDVDPEGDRGPRASGLGRTHRCPNDDQHSDAGNPDDKGFFCVNACDSDTGSAVASCRHDACAGLDRLNFTDLACVAAGIDDAMKLKRWVPELVGEGDDAAAPTGEDGAATTGDGEGAAPEITPYQNAWAAKKAVKALTEASEAGPIARNIGASGFSPAEQDELVKALVKKSGLGAKAIKDEIKLGRVKTAGDDDGEVTFDDDVAEQLARLNKTYAAVLMGDKFRIMKEPEKPGEAPAMLDRETFAAWLEHVRVKVTDAQGNTKMSPISQEWNRWKEKRMYDAVIFQPGAPENPKAYNIWKGFVTKPKKGKDWSLLHGHIRDNLCQGNELNYLFFMTWVAQMFQQPGIKVGCAMGIRGEKGTGKSVVFDWIRRAMGAPALKVAKREELVGGFNRHQQGLILLVCEEVFWKEDKQANGALKDMITSDEMMITPKGIDSMRFPNYMRVVLISNEEDFLPTDLKSERRFFVLICGNARMDDVDFFRDIETQMRNGGLEAMVHDFMTWDPRRLTDAMQAAGMKVPTNPWDALRKPLQTEGLNELARGGATPAELFLKYAVGKMDADPIGEFPDPVPYVSPAAIPSTNFALDFKKEVTVGAQVLHDHFVDWMNHNRIGGDDRKHADRALKAAMVNVWGAEHQRKTKGVVYVCPTLDVVRENTRKWFREEEPEPEGPVI
jgi:hypothetical protein